MKALQDILKLVLIIFEIPKLKVRSRPPSLRVFLNVEPERSEVNLEP